MYLNYLWKVLTQAHRLYSERILFTQQKKTAYFIENLSCHYTQNLNK
jgi:hypothetical protein